jgi:uncharacterized OB-fold protein/acyl dehydratase
MSAVEDRSLPAPSAAALLERARALLGGPAGEFRTGRDPVNLPMVHHWCQALGDTNPAYLDEEYAASSPRGHLIAPPGMLQTWIMDAPATEQGDRNELLRLLDDAGYTSVVAVNYEHDYLRELMHGERISVRSAAEDLSEEKSTALGPGVFTTVRHEYLTDDGEVVGIGRMRLLKFRPPPVADNSPPDPAPAADAVEAPPTPRPTPAVGLDNSYFWDGVAAGELRIQQCGGCAVLRHPPQPLCDRCGSTDQGHVVASGRGTVYSFVVHHGPPLAGVSTPHTALLVDLEEGVRMVSELADGADPARIRIGLPVRLEMKTLPGGQVRPAFRPDDAPAPTQQEVQR